MINKITTKLLVVATIMALILVSNNGTAQSGNDDIDSIAYDNVVRMVVEALNDSSINIAFCKAPDILSTLSALGDIAMVEKFGNTISALSLRQLQVIEILSGNSEMDSLIYIFDSQARLEGIENYFPSVMICDSSEWIMLLDSPYHKSDHYNTSLLKRYTQLNNRMFLDSNNFFTLYERGSGGICTYCPEDAKYPPRLIYSSGLVDDFKIIIELQKNPSLLSESDDSFASYYSSMKDDLGKRVFARLFAKPNEE